VVRKNSRFWFLRSFLEPVSPKGGLAVSEYIIVGIDAHKGSLVVKWAADKAEPEQGVYPNSRAGRRALKQKLTRACEAHGGARVVCGYEASYEGTGLCRELEEGGFACHVLAPTKLPRQAGGNKQKADPRDAEDLLEVLRGHLLAGNRLPAIWVPDEETLQHRELVRGRLDLGRKIGSVRSQVSSLLARWDVEKPAQAGASWTRKWRCWVEEAVRRQLPWGAGEQLMGLLRQVEFLESERARLDKQILELSGAVRYREPVEALRQRSGVGLLVAMVFLTELGELSRFRNRRQLAAYLGLVPSRHESAGTERKGHITRQGSTRVRKVLCQAAWVGLRYSPSVQQTYRQISAGPGKRHKIAIVALMRHLAIRMWHAGKRAQRQSAAWAVGAGTGPGASGAS
jgi:transposase